MARMSRKRHLLPSLLGMMLAGSVPAGAQERVVERRTTSTPAPRSPALLRRTMLDAHNAARRVVGVPPITWDEALARDAREYADELARTGRFAHSNRPQGPGRQGENLWNGTRDAYRYDEMAGHWVAEREDFINGITPHYSRTGRWQDVNHYAQIVWANTRQVGCALRRGRRDDYLVCRYLPSGNVVGERTYPER